MLMDAESKRHLFKITISFAFQDDKVNNIADEFIKTSNSADTIISSVTKDKVIVQKSQTIHAKRSPRKLLLHLYQAYTQCRLKLLLLFYRTPLYQHQRLDVKQLCAFTTRCLCRTDSKLYQTFGTFMLFVHRV